MNIENYFSLDALIIIFVINIFIGILIYKYILGVDWKKSVFLSLFVL